jgi:hypothetical protein
MRRQRRATEKSDGVASLSQEIFGVRTAGKDNRSQTTIFDA